MKHLSNLGTDGHLIRTFKEKHEFMHDERHSARQGSVPRSQKQLESEEKQSDVVRHSQLVVVDRNGSKLKTKSQKFDIE